MVRVAWRATVHRVTKESNATEHGRVIYILNESIPFLTYPSEATNSKNLCSSFHTFSIFMQICMYYILIIHTILHMHTEKFLSFLRSYHPTRATLSTSFQSGHVESLVPLNGCITLIIWIYHTLCMLSFTDRDLMVSRTLFFCCCFAINILIYIYICNICINMYYVYVRIYESEKTGLKLNIQKMKIMASGSSLHD